MAKVKTQTNAIRVAQIEAVIRDAVKELADPRREELAHKDAAQTLGASIQTSKVGILSAIAAASAANDWLPDEVDEACKRAAKGNEDPDDKRTQKTLAVMCSELRVVANSRVCNKFPVILAACREAWDAEALVMGSGEYSPDEVPVHRFASRFYNLVITMSRRVKDGDAVILTAEDMTNYATENDPDHDHKRIAGRIEKICATIGEAYRDFGHESLKLAMDYLGTLTPKELQASRAKLMGEEVPSTPAPKPTPTKPAPTPAPAPMSAADGVVALDDLMNDNPAPTSTPTSAPTSTTITNPFLVAAE